MCMISVVLSDFTTRHPIELPYTIPGWPPTMPWVIPPSPTVSREEFETLKRELEALKLLIPAVRAYDASTGQPDCDDAEKVALVKRLAALVGVDLEKLLDPSPSG